MEVDTFRMAAHAHTLWLGRRAMLVIAGFVLVVWVVTESADGLEANYGKWTSTAATCSAIILGGSGTIYLCVHMNRRHLKNPLLVCPHCHSSLHDLAYIVVASHNCPSCGRQVLEPPD